AGAIDGSNVYAYARGNPLRFVDALGLEAGEQRPWGSYLPGTQAGQDATQYYADLVVEGEKEGGFRGGVKQAAGWTGGLFAVLWTPDTAVNTAFTLGTAGLGSWAQAGRLGLASRPIASTLGVVGAWDSGVSFGEFATGESSGAHLSS